MNAAILLMASAVTAGQPAPAPAAPAPAAPAVVAGDGGCGAGGCGPVACGCDVGCSKKHSLFDKIKSRSGCHKHHCHAAPACSSCAPAPAPAPAQAPCATCDACSAPKASILDRLKAKFAGKKKHGCNDCAPACDGCAAAPAPAAPAPAPAAPAPAAPAPGAPVPNPMPRTTPKAEVVVPGVVTPVSGPRATGTTSPY